MTKDTAPAKTQQSKSPTDGMNAGDRSKLTDECVFATVTGKNPNEHGLSLALSYEQSATVLPEATGWISEVKDSAFKIVSASGGNALAQTSFVLRDGDVGRNAPAMINCETAARVTGPITGRVIGRQSKGSEVELLIAAGRAQGVRTGMTGHFKTEKGASVGELYVQLVSDTVCRATTSMVHEQVLEHTKVEIVP